MKGTQFGIWNMVVFDQTHISAPRVPQGSSLEPLRFLDLINNVSAKISLPTTLFAHEKIYLEIE